MVLKKDVLIRHKNDQGEVEVHYPITKAQNIDGLDEKISERVADDGYISTKEKGVAGGVASLGIDGKVPEIQLPEMEYDSKGSASAVEQKLDAHKGDKGNPHGVDKAQVGLGNVDNTSDADKPVSTAVQLKIESVEKSIKDKGDAVDAHKNDRGNPHGVTAVQTGADPAGSANAVKTQLEAHGANVDNPHRVTKAQIGLGNVDNTSDVDKPVSAAQKAAIDAVEGKADEARKTAESAQNTADEVKVTADNSKVKKLLATFTSSGTFNPAAYNLPTGYAVDIMIVGAGGGGAAGLGPVDATNAGSGGAGGGGGECIFLQNFPLMNASYPITVGSRGIRGSAGIGGNNANCTNATSGGSTSAFGHVANGGSGATLGYSNGRSSYSGAPGAGGSGGGIGGNYYPTYTSSSWPHVSWAGGNGGYNGSKGHGTANGIADSAGGIVTRAYYVFKNPYNNVTYGSGGAGGGAGFANHTNIHNTSTNAGGYMFNNGSFVRGGGNGGAARVNGYNATAPSTTFYGYGGSGGGGAGGRGSAGDNIRGGYGANGVNGVVFIYG